MSLDHLTQIRLGVHYDGDEIIPDLVEAGAYSKEETEYQNQLLVSCPAGTWPCGSHRAACPRPVLVNQDHQRMLQEMTESLTAAITSIVERWWTDHDAGFPQRMPLEKEEEDILKVREISNTYFPTTFISLLADTVPDC